MKVPTGNLTLFLLFVLIFLGFSPFRTAAQPATSSLSITVVAEDTNMAVPSASVVVSNRDGTEIFAEGKTDSKGRLELLGLPPGEVFVKVVSPEQGQDRALLVLVAGEAQEFEAFLSHQDSPDEIVIQDDRLLINATDPNSGATTRRSEEFLRRELTEQGSLSAVLATVPGTATNSLGQVHMRGEHRAISLNLDGVALPQATASSITQALDPTFIEAAEISTGMYDASKGGQTGAIIEATTPGEGRAPFAELEGKVGDFGQTELVLKAGGSSETEEGFSYFLGARRQTSDLYLEAPDPRVQDLNNSGVLNSVILRFNNKTERNKYGLTFSYQDADFGVPQTPNNFAAGVRQQQQDSNLLGVLSWEHDLSEKDRLLFGLALQRNVQRINNNGVFTPFFVVPEDLEEDLHDDGFPFDPENPGSPYLPTASLKIFQVQPSLDWTHRFDNNQVLKAGATANFIDSSQQIAITDPGGGGGLPDPLGLQGNSIAFLSSIQRNALTTGVYVDHTIPLGDHFVLNTGLRGETFDNGLGVRTSQLSPRFNLTYAPTDEQAFRLSYNRLFQPPPIEIDVSGQTEVLPQRTHLYELAYENQFAPNAMGRLAFVYKDFQDQVDIALLIPNSNIPVFAPINFARAHYKGIEASLNTTNKTGWNGFLALTLSEARPTEASLFSGPPPEFNDHDQRVQAKAGLSYSWENGLSAATDVLYASGFPQEGLPLYNSIGISPYGYTGERVGRFITNVNLAYRPPDKDGGTLGAGLQVFNLFNDRSLVNLYSEFSGSRFVTGRRFLFNINARF